MEELLKRQKEIDRQIKTLLWEKREVSIKIHELEKQLNQ